MLVVIHLLFYVEKILCLARLSATRGIQARERGVEEKCTYKYFFVFNARRVSEVKGLIILRTLNHVHNHCIGTICFHELRIIFKHNSFIMFSLDNSTPSILRFLLSYYLLGFALSAIKELCTFIFVRTFTAFSPSLFQYSSLFNFLIHTCARTHVGLYCHQNQYHMCSNTPIKFLSGIGLVSTPMNIVFTGWLLLTTLLTLTLSTSSSLNAALGRYFCFSSLRSSRSTSHQCSRLFFPLTM